jgi:hypothetical protein
MPLFLFILIHSFHHIHTVHSSVVIRKVTSPHCRSVKWEKPSRGAKPRIELGPALQQARGTTNWDTPHPSELCRTLTELRRTLLSYAAPLLCYAAPNWAHTQYHYHHTRYAHPTPASISANPHKARKWCFGVSSLNNSFAWVSSSYEEMHYLWCSSNNQ